jgi:putative peptidoglycan lipid II flippase
LDRVNIVGNEGQQPQQPDQPKQGSPGQQSYYGWQYEQDHPEGMVQQSPVVPQQAHVAPQSQQQPPAPGYPPQAYQGYGGQPQQLQQPPQYQQLPPRYQEPIADMGTSLGLGQGTEYQFFNAPQPTQGIPMLRQARLQQLREERMRRQQRRMKPDVTSMISFKGKQRPPEGRLPYPAVPEQMSPSWGPGAPPVPTQFSPALPLSPREASPARPPDLPPLAQRSPAAPAAAAAQDTGMMQKINVGRATLILTGAFVVSRVFGLLRTSLFAFVFGTGAISDAYLQAFAIPDLIFNIVAGGALSSAFIPVFTKYMIGEKDEKMAWHVASAALNLAIGIMIVLALLAIIFAGQIVPLYNPKTAALSPQVYAAHINLIVSLTRIMLLQAIILGSGVIVNSVLNARQHFLLPAIGTVLYNVGIIIGLIPGVVMAYHGQRNDLSAVYTATWGVVLGAVLQVAIQIPGLIKVGMRYTPTFDWRHPGVIQIGRQMVPRVINASVLYTSIFVDRYLISFLGVVLPAAALNGLITQYLQSLQLLLLPLGVFGMAVSTAAFPTLAENVARGRLDRLRTIIGETLRSILFMSIPSSVGLIVLGLPIIQVLLEHGAFTLLDAERTAYPLAAFAIGLAGLASVEILTRSFYALRDSTTPVIVSVSQFIFKIALSLILVNAVVWGPQYGTAALAFSTSIAGLLEAGVLLWLLHQRIGGLQLRLLGIFIGRVLLASLTMGIGILIIRLGLDLVLVTTSARDQAVGLGLAGTLMAFVKLLIELFAGALIYFLVARSLGIEELGPVRRVLDRFKLSWI